jgi:hypothetical protein
MEWKGSGCWRRNGFWLTARELNDYGCQHGNGGFLDAYMARRILAAYTGRERF